MRWPFRKRAVAPGLQALVNQALHSIIATQFGADRNPGTLDQMENNRSWAFAANRQIAGRGARVEPMLYHMRRRHGYPVLRAPVWDHPSLDLLAQPNPDESGIVFRWRALVQLNTIGRGYLLVEPEVFTCEQIGLDVVASRMAGMQLLEPDRIRVVSAPGRRGAAFMYTPSANYQPIAAMPAQGEITFPGPPATRGDRERWKQQPYPFVVPIVFPSPENPNGASPIQAAQYAIDNDKALSQMHRNQLLNGLHAGMIFYLLKDIDDPDRFQKTVLLLKQGLGKAGEPLVLPKKSVEVDKNPMANNEMGFEKLDESSRQEILAVLGASDGVVGLSKDVNRASFEGLERILAIGTIDPLLALFADAINTHILPLYRGQSGETWYELKFPSAAVADDLTQADRLVKLVGGKPVLSQNEARAELQRDPLPEGNSIEPPAKAPSDGVLSPLGNSIAQSPTSAPKRAQLGSGLTQPDGSPATPASDQEDLALAPGDVEPLPSGHPWSEAEARLAQWREVTQARAPMERSVRTAMAPVIAAWRDAVHDAIAGGKPLPDAQPTVNALAAILEKGMRQAAALAGSHAAAQAKLKRRATDDDWATARALQAAGELISTITETYKAALASAAEDFGNEPGPMADAAAAAFPRVTDPLLYGLASTELGSAYNCAIYYAAWALRDGGADVRVVWLLGGHTRASHRVLDGKMVRIGEAFPVGQTLMRHPLDLALATDAAETTGCRCVAGLVVLPPTA
jgi:phage portal protein BeeE